jgi:hypothetical protein
VQLHHENGAARLLTAHFARTRILPVCCLPQDKGLHHASTSPLPMCCPMSISGRLWRTRRNTDADWYYRDLGCPGRSEGHRVSRIGRAGATSLALTLVSGAEASELRRIERALKLRIERKKTEYNHLVRQRRCRENNLPLRTLTAVPGEYSQQTLLRCYWRSTQSGNI